MKRAIVPVEATPEMLEPYAREWCEGARLDPDEPEPPHGEYPRWYAACAAYSYLFAKSLAAAPNAGRVSRADLTDAAQAVSEHPILLRLNLGSDDTQDLVALMRLSLELARAVIAKIGLELETE